MFNSHGKKKHHYSARYKNLPNIMQHTGSDFNKSFLCKSIGYFNTLSCNIKNATNMTDFITKYKSQLFQGHNV